MVRPCTTDDLPPWRRTPRGGDRDSPAEINYTDMHSERKKQKKLWKPRGESSVVGEAGREGFLEVMLSRASKVK